MAQVRAVSFAKRRLFWWREVMAEEHGFMEWKVGRTCVDRRACRSPIPDTRRRREQNSGKCYWLAFTGVQARALLGVSGRMIRKWIGGEREIPYSAWRLLLIEVGIARNGGAAEARALRKRVC